MSYQRRVFPDTPPDLARRWFAEDAGDLKACWILLGLAEAAFNLPDIASKNASAALIHAYVYLNDRHGYEQDPWPKNMVAFPFVFNPPKGAA